jgi:hypothetical protein
MVKLLHSMEQAIRNRTIFSQSENLRPKKSPTVYRSSLRMRVRKTGPETAPMMYVLAMIQYWEMPHLNDMVASPTRVAPLTHVEKNVNTVSKKPIDLFARVYS